MALRDTAFLSLEEAKAYLAANVRDSSKDDQIEDLINAACEACEAFMGRKVLQRPVVEIRDGDGANFMYLRTAPATNVRVWIDLTRQFGDEAELIDLATDAQRGEFFVPDEADRVELLNGYTPRARGCVRVTYNGGWLLADIPAQILLAAKLVLQQAWNMAPVGKGMLGFASVSAQQAGSVAPISTIELTRAIPKQARELMGPFAETGLGF